jgi:hypothetical protein
MNNIINALHRWFGFLPLRHGQEQPGVVSSGLKNFRPGRGFRTLARADGDGVLAAALARALGRIAP